MRDDAAHQGGDVEELQRLRARVAKLERISQDGARLTSEGVEADRAWREWERTFDATKDSIVIIDPEFKIIQANVSTSRLLNIPLDEIVGKTCWELIHNSRQPPPECPLKKAYQSRHHEEVEIYIPERHIWVEASVSPLLDNTGNITSVVHILRDITARKQVEEALRKSEQEIRLIADNMPGLLSYVGTDERYQFVNRQYEEWFELPATQIVGRSCREVLGDKAYEEIEPYIRKVLCGEEVQFEDELAYSQGGARWVHAHYVPDVDKAGEVKGFFALVTDITERKNVVDALRESEEKYRNLFENAREAIITIDLKGNITGVNRLVEEYGIKREELVGKRLIDFVTKDHIARAIADFKSLIDGDPVEGEMDVVTPKGTYSVEYRDNPIRRGGRIVGVQAILTDITEHKRAERLLRKERDRAQKYLDVAAVMLIVIDSEQRVALINRKGCDILGYSEDEIIGKNWFDNFMPVGVRDEVREVFHAVVSEKADGPEYYENPVLTKNGDERLIAWHYTVLRDNEGKIIGTLSSGEDVTERKRAEEKIKLFSDAIASAFDCFMLTDIKGNITYANQSAITTFGYTFEEFLKLNITKLDADPKVAKKIAQETAVAGKWSGEVINIRKNKEKFPSLLSAFIVKDEKGNPKGTMGILRDITERKRAEEALRESEERFRRLYEQAPLGYQSLDAEGCFIDVNQAWLDLLGYSRDQVIGHWFGDFLAPQEVELFKQRFPRFIATGEVHVDLEIVQRTGSTIIVHIDGRIAHDEHGQFKQTHCILHDITARKQAEDALRESELRYRELADSITDVFFAMDKDLRYTYWNRASEKLTGIPAKDAIGKSLYEVFPDTPETRQAQEAYLNVLRTQQPRTFENEYRLGDKDFVFEISVYPSTRGLSVFTRDITERKLAEEALKKSAQLLSDTGEMAKVGGWELDLSTKEVFCTEETYRIHGIEPGYKLSLEEALNFYAPESIPPLKATLKKIAETGELYDLESLFIPRGSADKIWVRSLGRAIYSGGKIVKLAGTFQNIDKYKRAEDALRESEEKFSKAFRASPNLMSISTLSEGRIIDANNDYCALAGYSREEMIGRTVFDLNLWADPEQRKRMVEQVRTEGSVHELQVKLRTKSGEIRLLLFSAETITYAGELCLVSVATDITERKQAEDALCESEQKYRELFENAREAIITVDLKGNITNVNKLVEEYGFKRDQLIGKSSFDFNTEKDRSKSVKEFERLTRGIPVEGEVEIITPKGNVIAEYRSNPIIRGKQIIGVQEILIDITDRKKAEQELFNYQAKLKALATELTLAEERQRHQIATELHDQVSQALVLSKMELEELCATRRDKKLKEEIKSICESLGQTITDMRALTSDLGSPILHQLGLEQALREYLTEHIEGKHRIHTEFEDDGWPKPLDNDVRSLLFRDVRELLVNVVKHAKANKVRVAVHKDGSMIRITVEDDGVGFDPVAADSRAGGAGGFGLFSIRERLEELGGRFQIESSPGCGCKVTMTVPLKRKETTGGRNKTTRKGKRN